MLTERPRNKVVKELMQTTDIIIFSRRQRHSDAVSSAKGAT
jgi:hypothetical protein